MTAAPDTIIVGGGIAGLMSAVRLASAGARVSLYDRGLAGGYSTTSNHGMVHSGAFYSKWHPEIVSQCIEAVDLYASRFPDAVLARESIGYGRPETIDEMAGLWSAQGCRFKHINPSAVSGIFNLDVLEGWSFVRGTDLAVDPRTIVLDLVRTARYLGVTLHLHATVTGLAIDRHAVTGITLAGGRVEPAKRVILAAGLGVSTLSEQHSLRLRTRLRSRLDMMVAFPGGPLDHVVLCHDFGCPNIAPTRGHRVLASPYGGTQPLVRDYRRWPVPAEKLMNLAADLRRIFRPDLIDVGAGEAHMCSKTEMAGTATDQFGGQPGFAVVDHGEEDQIANLWSVLPGKMTLAFHASQALASRVLGTRVPMDLPPSSFLPGEDHEALVAVAPWHAIDQNAGAIPLVPAVR